MQGILWAAVLVLILAIVGCEMWRKPAPKVLTFVPGIPLQPYKKLQCGSPEAISSAKNYYDNKGQYAGVFVMDPISSYQVNENNCDVKFKYIPTPGSLRNDSEVDSRRFVYEKTGEGWQAVNMLDWKSGVLNM